MVHDPISGEINLIDRLLSEQRSLSAVDRFAQKQSAATQPVLGKFYRDLIPISRPTADQQYAFEVNLDSCTGCKACVSACHSLNGLEEDETWRDVGSLVGYQQGTPYQQTITTACHHCAEPACLEGCPVMAYEKDEKTGIVRHLDDQCIGCQYCTMKCPYEVPKYSEKLGIVRKCDMCHDRLAEGEAPACVQACPHEAITIRLVDREAARAKPGERMLPGVFPSDYTQPTTRYLSSRPIPRDAAAADVAVLRREHAHWPLIVMLLLTQFGAGLFVALALLALVDMEAFMKLSLPLAVLGFGVLNVGLIAAVFHLGRPLGAWRFFLGLRTSWMSREILAFSIFAGAASGVVAAAWLRPEWILPSLVCAVLALGAVFTSGMIYVDTHRPFWRAGLTMGRFFGTVFVTGSAGVAVVGLGLGQTSTTHLATTLAMVGTAVFFAWDMSRYAEALNDSDHPNHLSSRLVSEKMHGLVRWRGILLVLGLVGFSISLAGSPVWLPLALVSVAAGFVMERFVFFTAVVAPRMPGGMS